MLANIHYPPGWADRTNFRTGCPDSTTQLCDLLPCISWFGWCCDTPSYLCAGQSLLSTFILCWTTKEQKGCSTHLCVVLVFGEAATKQNIRLCLFTLEQESVHNFQCCIIFSQEEKVAILPVNSKYMNGMLMPHVIMMCTIYAIVFMNSELLAVSLMIRTLINLAWVVITQNWSNYRLLLPNTIYSSPNIVKGSKEFTFWFHQYIEYHALVKRPKSPSANCKPYH